MLATLLIHRGEGDFRREIRQTGASFESKYFFARVIQDKLNTPPVVPISPYDTRSGCTSTNQNRADELSSQHKKAKKAQHPSPPTPSFARVFIPIIVPFGY